MCISLCRVGRRSRSYSGFSRQVSLETSMGKDWVEAQPKMMRTSSFWGPGVAAKLCRARQGHARRARTGDIQFQLYRE